MRLTNALQNLGGTFGGVAGTIANLATSIINPAMQSSIDKVSQLQAAMQGVTGFLQKIFTCGGCNRVIEANAVLMMQELRGGSMALHKLEERAKCSECGHRGATVMPCEINF
jgi:phage-related protein